MKSAIADPRFRVICLRIVPTTGSPIYLTHHVRDLTMNGHTYLSTSGYDFSGYSAQANLSPALFELSGIAGLAGIGYDEIASGVFDGARAYLFATTWRAPVEDEEPITASFLGKTTLRDDRYVIEEMALIDALGQSVGKTYAAACPKAFGGQEYAGCKIALATITVTGTLTAVSSNSVVRDSARTEGVDWFGAGILQFTSGANAGLRPLEIKAYAADGTITTHEAFHYPPAIGDSYVLIPGCRKRLADCRDKWSNVANFGGFPHIPLGSSYAQVGLK